MGFFSMVGAAHPYRIGDIRDGKKIVQTYNLTTRDTTLIGDPWVVYEDGTKEKVSYPEDSFALSRLKAEMKKHGE